MAKLIKPNRTTTPPDLTKFERAVFNGGEWSFSSADWMVLQLAEGIAYAFDQQGGKELPLGGIIVCPPNSSITLRASVLGRALFRGMCIRIDSLMGFLTVLERECLEKDVPRQIGPFLSLPADHSLSGRVAQVLSPRAPVTLSNRLAFAQIFADLVGPQLSDGLNRGKERETSQVEARNRLRQLMGQLSELELSGLSLGEMAQRLHCCERHASRMFRSEYGVGFVAYVSELRLKIACELLRQGRRKIIDVALESGHGSLAHFNSVFKKRYQLTPTEWRDRLLSPRRPSRPQFAQFAAVLAVLTLALLGSNRSFGAPSPTTNSPAPVAKAAAPRLQFKVERYEIVGNTVLSNALINRILKPYTGESVGLDKITNAMAVLQSEYFRRGYVTVKVTVPPQKVTNNFITFEVTEGRLAIVKVVHNHYFSSNNVVSSLPYVKTLTSGQRILNSKVFQTELDRANSNPDRQIAPEIRPGLEPGTSALILDVKDRLPFHARADLDNYSPPGTPELRVNANASYDNLWQLEHSLGVQYGFSPETMKPSIDNDTHLSLTPLDSPDVTYYSAFYRAPLGPPVAVENQIAQDNTHFGYNETTRQFVQPPSTARPEFTAYASRSTTGPTIYGPVSTVVGGGGGTNNVLTINKQLISQQYTAQTTAGFRVTYPLPSLAGIQSTLSIGADYKDDKVVTLPTNYFYSTTTVTHGSGGAPPTTTQSTIAIPGTASYPYLSYTPLFLGWSGTHQDHWFQFGRAGDVPSEIDGSLSTVAGTGGTISKDKTFPSLITGTTEATTEFVAARGQVSRLQMLPDNFSFYGNLSGQWANEPLLNLEQFELGGYQSVRGYREGELYSDDGVLGQAELRTPVYWRGASSLKIGSQMTAFTDYGRGFELSTGQSDQSLWGAGLGFNFHFGSHVESHIIVAWPFLSSAYTKAGHERTSFSLSAQF